MDVMYRVGPTLYMSPVEIPGLGQISGATMQDAASEAEYALESQSAAQVLAKYGQQLEAMVEQHTWRSSAAADLLLRLKRQYATALSTPKDDDASSEANDDGLGIVRRNSPEEAAKIQWDKLEAFYAGEASDDDVLGMD